MELKKKIKLPLLTYSDSDHKLTFTNPNWPGAYFKGKFTILRGAIN